MRKLILSALLSPLARGIYAAVVYTQPQGTGGGLSHTSEGSYGLMSRVVERPASAAVCVPQMIGLCP